MRTPLFIGDDISAAGFRLSGTRIRSPLPEELAQTLAWANQEASLIMISAGYAALLPPAQLQVYLTQETPLFVVIPDIRSPVDASHLTAALRSQLGVLG